ncbi:family 16 glycoside hydrolase [Muriicola sp. E247]|uniref:family 16 glycoside hydrolase n=1 Tax=Muriicola sp. E247 TaxID=3242730 RepID=UPI003525DBAA
MLTENCCSGRNEVQIGVRGQDIKIKINGVTTAEFTEEGNVPAEGCICLQAHGGEPYGL